MFEILALLVLLAWVVFSIWLAARVTRLVRHGTLKVLIFVLLAPLLAALPLADEIIGKFHFDRLCKEAEEIKIYTTLAAGVEFYFPDERWKLSDPSLPFAEVRRLGDLYEKLVRYENKSFDVVSITIPISAFETRIYSRKNNVLLASYKTYGTRGGWLSRGSEKPIIVRNICWPPAVDRDLRQRISTLNKSSGEKQ